MKLYIFTIVFILSLHSKSQLSFELNSDLLRTSLTNDEFLSRADLEPEFDEVVFKSFSARVNYTIVRNDVNFGASLSMAYDREWISGFVKKNSSGYFSNYNLYSTFRRYNLGIFVSRLYDLKSLKLKSTFFAETDFRTIDWKKYNSKLGVVHEGVFLTSAHSFTSLNLSFQQSIQLNKSEKNPLWFNLNMRYIPWTEYTYNQHTLWFGAGLSLGFNGGG